MAMVERQKLQYFGMPLVVRRHTPYVFIIHSDGVPHQGKTR